MKPLLFALLLASTPLLASAPETLVPAAAAPAQKSYQLDVTGAITIDMAGKVFDFALETKLPEAIAALVDSKVRQWSFEPVKVDGRAVVARTKLHLRLATVPLGDGQVGLKIGGISFGAPIRHPESMRVPRYPEGAMKAGIGAQVVLLLELDASGRVQASYPEQTSLSVALQPVQAMKLRRSFEHEAIEAARTWSFDLTETVDGRSVGMLARLPVMFYPASRGGQDAWMALVPGPIQAMPGHGAVVAPVADADESPNDDEAVALGSNFKLLQPVIGTML